MSNYGYLKFVTSLRWADLASDLGFAVRLNLSTPRAKFRMEGIDHFLWPAVQLRQIAFLYDELGAPFAYASWAFLTPSVADELRSNPERPLEMQEWNEGTQLWIMDVVAPGGGALRLLRAIQRAMPHHDAGFALRRRPDGGSRVSQVSWTRAPRRVQPAPMMLIS